MNQALIFNSFCDIRFQTLSQISMCGKKGLKVGQLAIFQKVISWKRLDEWSMNVCMKLKFHSNHSMCLNSGSYKLANYANLRQLCRRPTLIWNGMSLHEVALLISQAGSICKYRRRNTMENTCTVQINTSFVLLMKKFCHCFIIKDQMYWSFSWPFSNSKGCREKSS